MASTTNDAALRTLTVEDVAELLGVRAEAVRIWIRDGRLRAAKWGRRLRIRPEAVRDFQEACALPALKDRLDDFARKARNRGAWDGKPACR